MLTYSNWSNIHIIYSMIVHSFTFFYTSHTLFPPCPTISTWRYLPIPKLVSASFILGFLFLCDLMQCNKMQCNAVAFYGSHQNDFSMYHHKNFCLSNHNKIFIFMVWHLTLGSVDIIIMVAFLLNIRKCLLHEFWMLSMSYFKWKSTFQHF